jgi:hypothetical protein
VALFYCDLAASFDAIYEHDIKARNFDRWLAPKVNVAFWLSVFLWFGTIAWWMYVSLRTKNERLRRGFPMD